MAIEKKIPTPSEIKSNPLSFSESELKELTILRDNLHQTTISLGTLFVQKIRLEEQEKQLKKQMIDLENQESSIAANLTKKYGKGSINLETGTFTPQ